MKETLCLALTLLAVACAPAQRQTERTKGEFGMSDGKWLFRECATGTESSALMLSSAASTYAKRLKELGATRYDLLLLEADIQRVKASDDAYMTITHVVSIDRATCSAV